MPTEPDTANAGETARFLVRAARHAALGTLTEDGAPYVSLVETACDGGGAPMVLISALAQHTMNLRRDGRASLLIHGGARLDQPRVTLIGTLRPEPDEQLKARYVAQHPSAARYSGFTDFGLWRMTLERAHLVAGFGRIAWIEGGDLVLAETVWMDLAAAESGIVDHMNEDHADALSLYATALEGASPGAWRMTGIDPEGFDIADGTNRLRLTFDTFVRSSQEARVALVDLVKRARLASTA
ncbi:MAG: HugZ family protein [Sphingomonadales bacterium]